MRNKICYILYIEVISPVLTKIRKSYVDVSISFSLIGICCTKVHNLIVDQVNAT
jgi:hypothetical protein